MTKQYPHWYGSLDHGIQSKMMNYLGMPSLSGSSLCGNKLKKINLSGVPITMTQRVFLTPHLKFELHISNHRFTSRLPNQERKYKIL